MSEKLDNSPADAVAPVSDTSGPDGIRVRRRLAAGLDRWPNLGWVAATFAACWTVTFLISMRALRVDLFFDEMWRYDMIRSADPRQRYLLHDTPIPPGWMYLFHWVGEVIPPRRPIVRLESHLIFTTGMVLLADLIRRVLDRRPHQRATRAIASTAAALTCISPLVAHPQTWFNNYGFEITAAVLLVWLCLLVDAGCHRARPWLLVVLALGPLFVQGALLLWPAAIAFVLFDARRTGTLRRSALPFAVTGTAMMAGAGLVYALFYRPVGSKDSITSYWAADSLDGDSSVGTLLRNGLTSLQHGVVPTHNSTLPFEPDVPLWLVLMACIVGVIGAIAISVWRWFFVFPAVGQLGAIVASALTGWPVTPVRLNVPYWTFIIVLVPLGTGVVVAALASRARASERVTSALVVLAALGIVLALWPTRLSQNAQNGAVYARGLSADFARVAQMSGPDNIVLSYHHMSHWYAHDTLMNSEQPGKSFVLLWETLGDDSLYADVDAAIAPLVGPNTDVWCVIPYEVGPDATAQACQITLPGLVQTFEADLGRALVIRYSVAATS